MRIVKLKVFFLNGVVCMFACERILLKVFAYICVCVFFRDERDFKDKI